MEPKQAQVVVAGHICLDIIPTLHAGCGLEQLLVPGKLVDVGAATVATGGAVANTGLALHRLGLPTRLMGKVGDDLLGGAILSFVRRHGQDLAAGMIVTPGEASSYTVVLNPPGVDRIFLHCPGCNDTYGADDVDLARLDGARLFHFGYPPLMKRFYSDGGAELKTMLEKVKQRGLTVSLDMARPDPASPAGRADWPAILAAALPHVDLFLPSLEEILYMLDRPRYDLLAAEHGADGILRGVGPELLDALAARMLALGVAVVAIKLGELGLYLRTTSDERRLARMGGCAPADARAWAGRELISECFDVRVVGATGAGDCTIGGLLAGLLLGRSPEQVVTLATAVGACNVEAADASSGIVPLEAVERRLADGWRRHRRLPEWPGWRHDTQSELWFGPRDASAALAGR